MKKTRRIHITAALLLMLAGMLLVTSAFAGTSLESSSSAGNVSGEAGLRRQLNDLPPCKFEKHKNGIGYGLCPVYTAPSEDSYRCANGKAACQTNAAMDDAGFVSGWLLVRYELNSGGYRVGYIPPKYVRNYKSKMYPHFGYIPATADDYLYVSDNCYRHDDAFAVLEPGETFYVLSRYDYYAKEGFDWWYIECTVDGQVARGFIDYAGSSFTLGY